MFKSLFKVCQGTWGPDLQNDKLQGINQYKTVNRDC